jgi:hypothetical protein
MHILPGIDVAQKHNNCPRTCPANSLGEFMSGDACIVRGIVAFDNGYPKWDMRPQLWLHLCCPKVL